ncbi:MAG: MFS transporter [Actinomycetota bacterium]
MPSRPLGGRFWLLWSSTAMTNVADGISLTAFPLLAEAMTDDARGIALVSVGRFLPFVLVGLPLGVVVDRLDRRTVVFASQALRGAATAALAVIVATDGASISLLVAVAFIIGLGEVLTDSAGPAMVRQVVEQHQLEDANARLAATQTVANYFVGPPLGAALFVAATWLPFAAVVAAFGLGMVLILVVPGNFRPERPESTERFRTEVAVGLRYVWGHPLLRPLALTVAAFAFLDAAGMAVFVVLTTDRLGLGELGFGALVSIDAAASTVMSLFVVGLIARWGHANCMRFAVVSFGVSAVVLGLTQNVAIAALAVLLAGAGNPAWNVVSTTLRQRLVPDEVFGRMMTAYLFIAWGVTPLGAILGGVVAEGLGVEWVFLLQGPAMVALYVGARSLFDRVDEATADDG